MKKANVQIFGVNLDVEPEEIIRRYPSGPILRGKTSIEKILEVFGSAVEKIKEKDLTEIEFEIIRIQKKGRNSLYLKRWKMSESSSGKTSAIDMEYDLEADFVKGIGKVIIYPSFQGLVVKNG